ncbi:hypothetical protein BCA33_01225 [Marinobacter sp. AC-23]|nr:hypothetical protein BCA33_01225 [Marinobacter sp. AC-23]
MTAGALLSWHIYRASFTESVKNVYSPLSRRHHCPIYSFAIFKFFINQKAFKRKAISVHIMNTYIYEHVGLYPPPDITENDVCYTAWKFFFHTTNSETYSQAKEVNIFNLI